MIKTSPESTSCLIQSDLKAKNNKKEFTEHKTRSRFFNQNSEKEKVKGEGRVYAELLNLAGQRSEICFTATVSSFFLSYVSCSDGGRSCARLHQKKNHAKLLQEQKYVLLLRTSSFV